MPPGKYHISVDPSVPPVVRPPRRAPHSKRDPLKKGLDRMDYVGIIETSIRVWLDPKDVNVAIEKKNTTRNHTVFSFGCRKGILPNLVRYGEQQRPDI